MRLEKCYFCGGTVYPGHGIQFVRNDCTVFKFCTSKCHKNFKLKRNPRKTRWTRAFKVANNKIMTVDKSLQFEKKRNRPMKTDRNLIQTTIQAMKRIDEITEARKIRFYKQRMAGVKTKEKLRALKEIDESISIIRMPSALEKMRAKIQDNKNKIDKLQAIVTQNNIQQNPPKQASKMK
eukprot:gene3961-4955_t